MKQVIEIFKQLQNTSGKKDKEAILAANADNELFKQCLIFLCDSNITTGIAKKKYDSITVSTSDWVHNDINKELLEMFEYIKTNNTGKDENILNVKAWCYDFDEESQEFVKGMITKSIKLGIQPSTVNKIIPNLIFEWKVQLGSPSDKLKLKKGEKFFLSQKLNGCFEKGTPIVMADGTYKPIQDIQVGDEVLSFDETTNKISKQKVTRVFDNGYKPVKDWVRLGFGFKRSILSKVITVTKNHKFYTKNGWVEAGKLQAGDKVYVRKYKMSPTQISALIGIGLGDGSVVWDNPNLDAIRFSFPKKEEGYSNYFENFMNLFDIYRGHTHNLVSGYGTQMKVGHITTMYDLPRELYNRNNVVKCSYTFTDEILKHFTPLALAIYYIDDGSKNACKEDGYEQTANVKPRAYFATHRHPLYAVQNFSNFLLKEYGIQSTIHRYQEEKYKDKDMGYSVSISADGTEKLFNLIAKYIPYELRDIKLSKKWHDVPFENWFNDIGQYELQEQTLERVTDCSQLGRYKQKQNIYAYDLEIENNHTYFAREFAVHNCRGSYVDGQFISRQGKQITGLQHIIDDIYALNLDTYFIDGELIRKNTDNVDDNTNFRLSASIINSDADSKPEIEFVIFDMFPKETIVGDKTVENYSIRKQRLLDVKKIIEQTGVQNLKIVEMVYEGSDTSEIDKWLDRAVEWGWEG